MSISTPIQEQFPQMDYEWRTFSSVSWEDLIRSFGYTVHVTHRFDSYSGDGIAIMGNGEQLGILVFGYGSCSGCDALEACNTYERLDELRQSLHNKIKWYDTDSLPEAIAAFLMHAYITNQWYWHDNEIKKQLFSLAGQETSWW